MMYVQNAHAKKIPIEHLVRKHKEHEENMTSWNERETYWRAYNGKVSELVQPTK